MGLATVLALAACADAGQGKLESDAMPPPPCGNGKLDPFEQCEDGNNIDGDGCSATCQDEKFGSVTIQWEFNTDKKGMDTPPVFTSDSCVDFVAAGMGTTYIRMRATAGPEMRDMTEECGNGQINLTKLPVGNYTFEATMQWTDPGGARVDVSKAKSFMVTIPPGGAPPNPRLVFTNADFASPPQGWFFFQTRFSSRTATGCSAVTPAVVQQRLTMTPKAGGPAVTLRTASNVPLDGSAAGPCTWPTGTTDTQRAENLRSDLYSFRLEGLDSSGAVVYCSTSTVFVGAGRLNPTYDLLAPAGTSCPP